jgi:hypothetical protein
MTEKISLNIIRSLPWDSLTVIISNPVSHASITLSSVDVAAGIITGIGPAAAPHASEAFYTISLFDQEFIETPR